MKRLLKQWPMLFMSMLSAALSCLTLILTPYYLGIAMDAMMGVGTVDFERVTHYLIMASLMYGVHFISTWACGWLANIVSVNFVSSLRMALKTHLDVVPLQFLDTHAQGDVLSLFSLDGELIVDGLYQALTQVSQGVWTILITLIFMLRLNLMMSAIVLVMVPFVYFSTRWVSKHSMTYFRKQQRQSGALGGFVSETLDNYELVETYQYHDHALETFEALNQEVVRAGIKAQFIAALTNPTARFVHNITYAFLGIGGAFAIWNQGLTVGLFSTFITYAVLFSKPFNEISAIMPQIFAGKAGYERYKQVLDIEVEKDIEKEITLDGKTVSFEHVDFSYVPNHPILHDLNLEIAPLSKVAIVGPTGAGKSTMINLLMRYYDVDSGVIKIDGVDTSTISRASVRHVMGIVLQDPWLFEGTILENLRFGNADASIDAVHAAIEQVGLTQFVADLDQGLDTHISANLSQGQKQLITIARALLMDAPIMVLDEATSSVDSLTEKHIQTVFTEIMASHTSFFVAHRLSTVMDSDLILVMKAGRLIEQGTHASLMDLKGFYYELFMSQYA